MEVGTVVQIQNQKGNEPLKWDKSGVVIENRGNNQYSIRMDGSGRITLRNRQFLRQIKPAFEKLIDYGEDIQQDNGQSDVSVRRSGRVRSNVDRYQAS